mgnify:CR=1 FL=1
MSKRAWVFSRSGSLGTTDQVVVTGMEAYPLSKEIGGILIPDASGDRIFVYDVDYRFVPLTPEVDEDLWRLVEDDLLKDKRWPGGAFISTKGRIHLLASGEEVKNGFVVYHLQQVLLTEVPERVTA